MLPTVYPTPQMLHPRTLTLPYWALILLLKHLETEKTSHKKAKDSLLQLGKDSFSGLIKDSNNLDHPNWSNPAPPLHMHKACSDHRPLQISPGENLDALNFDHLLVEAPLRLVGNALSLVVDTQTEDLHSKKRLIFHSESRQEIRMCIGDRIWSLHEMAVIHA